MPLYHFVIIDYSNGDLMSFGFNSINFVGFINCANFTNFPILIGLVVGYFH